jgi:exodeoxyribonuclease V alpha subunit
MNRGICGADNLNTRMQAALNPPRTEGWAPEMTYGDVVYRAGDRVMQISNNYDYQVFNGDLGRMLQIDTKQKNFTVRYESNTVTYAFDEVDQIRLAYAITIHKSQGSEFPVVIVPVLNQHYIMLQRNLIYTAMTRAAQLLIMIGAKKALSIAVHNVNQAPRHSQLAERLQM